MIVTKLLRTVLCALGIFAMPGLAGDAPTDAQIVGIVLAANQIDIDYGKLALKRSRNRAVREFAELMVRDHSAVQKAVMDLASKLGIRSEDSPAAMALKKGASEMTAKLMAAKGMEFDRLYLENEVGYHKAVTDTVQSVLIPGANHRELKSALEGAQPLFLTHLDHARHAARGGVMGQ